MGVRVGINGFGRIGRNFFRAQHALEADIEVVALNDLGDAKTMAHLLRYDSNLGPFQGEVELAEGMLRAAGEEVRILSERDPAALPWSELGVDAVLLAEMSRLGCGTLLTCDYRLLRQRNRLRALGHSVVRPSEVYV